MDYRKITAIIRINRAERVQNRLKAIGIPGMSCTHVNGYGEYANFYTSDCRVEHARIEIFAKATQANGIVNAIMEEARTGIAGDGIVAVLPVKHLYHIRTGEESKNEANRRSG